VATELGIGLGLVPFDTPTSLLMSTRAQFEKKNDFRVLDF
jgi:hypothetical protein